MFYLYCILLFIIILLIIPIPIKLTLNYTKLSFNIYIYIFKFKLNLNKPKNFFKRRNNKIKKNIKKDNHEFDLKRVFALLNYIESIKYKPTLRFKLYCNYGLIDASQTAIAYGYIHLMSPYLYELLNKVFKIKKYDYNIKPDFDKTFFESNINSIIFVNIIKIIYMFVLIKNKIKQLQKIK